MHVPEQAAEERPLVFPKRPAGQRLQKAAPDKENVPIGQRVAFTEERGQLKPAGQRTGIPEEQ